MMKKRNIFLWVCLLGLTACSDWLNVQPKTSIDEEDLFKNEYGFKDALTGFYIKMGESSLYARELSYNYIELLAQQYDDGPDIHYDPSVVYSYDGTFKSLKNNVFSKAYNIIANINNFLAYLEKNREVIVTDHYYEMMKGEALGLRAFLHFDLLRLFGPVYSVAPTELSIPYCKVFHNVASPVLPANEVVENVLADLHAADSLLEKSDSKIFDYQRYESDREPFLVMRQLRMNTFAVKALLARVYCYKGDPESKQKACDYAQDVIKSSYFELAESNDVNRILFSEHIFSLHVYELDKIVDADFVNHDVSTILSMNQETWETVYETTGDGTTDFRKNDYAFRTVRESVGMPVKYVLNKYDQSVYSQSYDGAELIPLIRLPEMYYILAECDPSPNESAEYLNRVRFTRGIPYSNAISGEFFDKPDGRANYDHTQTMRTNEIMKDYRKEYYGEGQLFYFYKKYNYKTFYHCPLDDVRSKYKIPLPDNEITFGTTK